MLIIKISKICNIIIFCNIILMLKNIGVLHKSSTFIYLRLISFNIFIHFTNSYIVKYIIRQIFMIITILYKILI